jgi:hypothetical protein
MVDSPRVEDLARALLLARRALTQSLFGLRDEWLWRPPKDAPAGEPPIGALVCAVWEREGYWLWPPALPPPRLEPRPGLSGLLYGLVRHRAVTEDLLLRTTDADLEAPYLSAARRAEGAPGVPLAVILPRLAAEELEAVPPLQRLRRGWQPDWSPPAEAWQQALGALRARG